MNLTETKIKNIKTKKKIRIYDERGLYLEVTPSGNKWWRLKYRFGDKEKKLALGVYPDVSLKRAREKRDEARCLIADGIDPSEQRKAMKRSNELEQANTLEVIAREWIVFKGKQKADMGGYVERYTNDLENRLTRNVFPYIGKRPIAELSAPEILKMLKKIEERGACETAHRVLGTLGQIYRYAIATSRAKYDVTRDLKGALLPVKKGHLPAMIKPEQVSELLRAIDGYEGDEVVRCLLKLSPHFFLRPGELRLAKWSEFDLENKLWCIPSCRMKIKSQDHFVPLSNQAMNILKELHILTGHREYLFPGPRDWKRPLSNNTANAALRRMGYNREQMCMHGFRAIARTLLDEILHFRLDFIEHQMAHAVRDATGRAYNRTTHLPDRIKMMQAWSDYLDDLKEGKAVQSLGEVIQMKTKEAS